MDKTQAMTHKYRVEAGVQSPVVGQVDVRDGKIVSAPNIWSKFIGQPFYKLEWWLAAKHQTMRKSRIVDVIEVVDNIDKAVKDSKNNADFYRQLSTSLADVVLPTYCGCNELLENLEQLEAHVERGCWRKA